MHTGVCLKAHNPHSYTHLYTPAHTQKHSKLEADLKKWAHGGDIFKNNQGKVLLKSCVTEGSTTQLNLTSQVKNTFHTINFYWSLLLGSLQLLNML